MTTEGTNLLLLLPVSLYIQYMLSQKAVLSLEYQA